MGVGDRWGSGREWHYSPACADDERAREWLGRLQTQSRKPGNSQRRYARYPQKPDVRPHLCGDEASTLIIHAGDRVCDVLAAAYLRGSHRRCPVRRAGRIRLCALHRGGRIVADVKSSSREFARSTSRIGSLATIMFTDIVGSTEHARTVGDRRWRELLQNHHVIVRRELERYRGRELDTAGDRFFALPRLKGRRGDSVRAERESGTPAQTLKMKVRTGLRTGECEQLGDKLSGIAVHIGSSRCGTRVTRRGTGRGLWGSRRGLWVMFVVVEAHQLKGARHMGTVCSAESSPCEPEVHAAASGQ